MSEDHPDHRVHHCPDPGACCSAGELRVELRRAIADIAAVLSRLDETLSSPATGHGSVVSARRAHAASQTNNHQTPVQQGQVDTEPGALLATLQGCPEPESRRHYQVLDAAETGRHLWAEDGAAAEHTTSERSWDVWGDPAVQDHLPSNSPTQPPSPAEPVPHLGHTKTPAADMAENDVFSQFVRDGDDIMSAPASAESGPLPVPQPVSTSHPVVHPDRVNDVDFSSYPPVPQRPHGSRQGPQATPGSPSVGGDQTGASPRQLGDGSPVRMGQLPQHHTADNPPTSPAAHNAPPAPQQLASPRLAQDDAHAEPPQAVTPPGEVGVRQDQAIEQPFTEVLSVTPPGNVSAQVQAASPQPYPPFETPPAPQGEPGQPVAPLHQLGPVQPPRSGLLRRTDDQACPQSRQAVDPAALPDFVGHSGSTPILPTPRSEEHRVVTSAAAQRSSRYLAANPHLGPAREGPDELDPSMPNVSADPVEATSSQQPQQAPGRPEEQPRQVDSGDEPHSLNLQDVARIPRFLTDN